MFVFKGLKRSDLEDLQEDIKVYMELENGKNLDYWKDLEIIVDDEIHKLCDNDGSDGKRYASNVIFKCYCSFFYVF